MAIDASGLDLNAQVFKEFLEFEMGNGVTQSTFDSYPFMKYMHVPNNLRPSYAAQYNTASTVFAHDTLSVCTQGLRRRPPAARHCLLCLLSFTSYIVHVWMLGG